MEHLSSSLLFAIQQIPGETRIEKFKEIGRIVNRIIDRIKDESEFISAVNEENVPNTLVALIKVLVGVKIKFYTFIIEALKSDDTYLIIEALRARWFYDGSNKSITNYDYYSKEILPFVSMRTRRKIVKKLAVCLGDKQTEIAEDFFKGFVANYDVQEASNFLPACSSEFIYDAIVKHKIVLSNKMLKTIYRKYPDAALRYIKFMNPHEKKDETGRIMFRAIDAANYETFMPLLVTKHPEVFATVNQICVCSVTLGNRRTMMFLKNAKQILIQKPKYIIDIMAFKLVCDNLTEEEFETMFGNMFVEQWDNFNLDEMLNYLEYYPEEKRATLLRDKFKDRYGFDLYDKVEKLSCKFLLLLPKEKRFEITRRILEIRHKIEAPDSETSWWCYLPVEEAIPAIKLQIAKNWKYNKKQKYFSQLVYVCKLNENKEALLDVLSFVDDNHKYESSEVICNMLDRITQEFDITTFDEKYWTLLFNIIKRVKLKKENARDYWVLIKILKKNVHYCDEHNLPTDEIINVIVKLFVEGRVGVSWKLLEDEPEYERRYLDICFKHPYWLNVDYKKNVIEGIYGFNERHVTAENSVQGLSIKDYPDLLAKVEEILKKEQNESLSWVIYTKEKLKKHETELYDAWFPNKADSQSETNENSESRVTEEEKSSGTPEVKEKIIYLTEAIIALKKNYDEIKGSWHRYYECCKNEVHSKKRRRVRLFLKSLRWYQDVPVKFVEQSIKDEDFNIMGYLLDGITFSKVAQTFLPNETVEDSNSRYINILYIAAAIRNTTTPLSMDFIHQYLTNQYMYGCKNFINNGLKLWTYASYRTASDRMIAFSKNLINTCNNRLFIKKYSIRLIEAMTSKNEVVDFCAELWKTEKSPVIRSILVKKARRVFAKNPSQETWNLTRDCMVDLSISESDLFDTLIGTKSVSPEFASPYTKQVFDKIKEYVKCGMSVQDATRFLDELFENLRSECKDELPEELCKDLISFYLQYNDWEFVNADRFLVKVYLNTSSINFDERTKYMTQVFKDQSERWYNMSIDKKQQANNFIDSFVKTVVNQVQTFNGNLKLVETVYNIFSTIFTPYQHTHSYIMLFLSVEFLRVQQSFKEFGLQLGDKLKTLVEKYTPEYFMMIVDLIKEFICNFNAYEYSKTIMNRLNFLRSLVDSQNRYGHIIAAKLFSQNIVTEYNYQYCKILEDLSKSDDPLVQLFL